MRQHWLSTRPIRQMGAANKIIEVPRANKFAVLMGVFPMLVVPALARAQPRGEISRGDIYGPHMMWDGGWPGMILWSLLILLFFAAVVLVIRWVSGAGHRSLPAATSRETPLDTLKERFARGEIDKAEFEERRRLLES